MSYRDFKGIMRPGQNKRRGRNPNNPGNPNNPNNPNPSNTNQNRPRGPHRVQTFDSSGPSVKIRGNAYQVFERYVALAREAALSGDRIAAENLYQHAEHYFRVMNANGDAQGQPPRPTTPADTEMMGAEHDGSDHQQQPMEQPQNDHQQHQQRRQAESTVQPQHEQQHEQPHEQPNDPFA